MPYEVEQKFPVTDLSLIERRLATLGVSISEPLEEVDLYFAHPSRDFSQTDEALRIRCSTEGNSITYKGPKIDATTKTRKEIDIRLPEDPKSFASFRTLLGSLGFTPVGEVHKSRRKAWVPWRGIRIEVSLDQVVDVGTFVELEWVTESERIDEAKQCLGTLADELGLSKTERRSYLELLLSTSR